MIRRLFVDNFGCLVNFEAELMPLQLLLGPNGGGKSTVFEAIRTIQRVLGGSRLHDVLPSTTRTRWQLAPVQKFEITLVLDDEQLVYSLKVEHDDAQRRSRILHERLEAAQTPLFEFVEGEVRLYRDDGSEGPHYSFDWTQSALAFVSPRHDNVRLTRFRDALDSILVVAPTPPKMEDLVNRESKKLAARMENTVAWYHDVSQDQGVAIRVVDAIREIIPGFSHFKFETAGEMIGLLVVREDNRTYRWCELSDGERMLCALYMLVSVHERHRILCVDEPANYVGLSEIGPWLDTVTDLCDAGLLQMIVISHHPIWIDRNAVTRGLWLEREPGTPTRATKVRADAGAPMPVSVLAERGWIGLD